MTVPLPDAISRVSSQGASQRDSALRSTLHHMTRSFDQRRHHSHPRDENRDGSHHGQGDGSHHHGLAAALLHYITHPLHHHDHTPSATPEPSPAVSRRWSKSGHRERGASLDKSRDGREVSLDRSRDGRGASLDKSRDGRDVGRDASPGRAARSRSRSGDANGSMAAGHRSGRNMFDSIQGNGDVTVEEEEPHYEAEGAVRASSLV